MILYAETSAVLRWLLRAPRAEQVYELLGGAERVVCSRLTLGEAKRALSRLERLQEVAPDLLVRARNDLAMESAGWDVMEVVDSVWWRAEEVFPIEPVRMLDAIHLATARRFADMLGVVSMLSVDDRVVRNWRAYRQPTALEST